MPRDDENSLDYWRKDDPVCPHCDEEYNIQDREDWRFYDTKYIVCL